MLLHVQYWGPINGTAQWFGGKDKGSKAERCNQNKIYSGDNKVGEIKIRPIIHRWLNNTICLIISGLSLKGNIKKMKEKEGMRKSLGRGVCGGGARGESSCFLNESFRFKHRETSPNFPLLSYLQIYIPLLYM